MLLTILINNSVDIDVRELKYNETNLLLEIGKLSGYLIYTRHSIMCLMLSYYSTTIIHTPAIVN